MRFLPAGFPFRQDAAEHAEQIAAGGQLSLAEKNELLCRDLRSRLDLGEVRAVIADPVGERLVRKRVIEGIRTPGLRDHNPQPIIPGHHSVSRANPLTRRFARQSCCRVPPGVTACAHVPLTKRLTSGVRPVLSLAA
jgi:hypothetical protein